MTKAKNKKEGFVALISSIIISAILLIIATNTSFTGFYNRFNILDSEIKNQSFALADSCLDIAILNLHKNIFYAGNENVDINENSCFIGPINTIGAQKTFKIQAIYKNSYTNLKVTLNSPNISIISVEEIPVF